MTDRTSLQLPGILGDLARRGHGGAALILADRWGGTKRYLSDKPGSALVDLIGGRAAAILVQIISDGTASAGRPYDIPRAAVLEALKPKILVYPGTTRETAVALGVTERYVRMVRNAGASTVPGRRRVVDARQISFLD